MFIVILPIAPPVAPSGLLATASAERQIDLAWADNSWNEDSFQIERGLLLRLKDNRVDDLRVANRRYGRLPLGAAGVGDGSSDVFELLPDLAVGCNQAVGVLAFDGVMEESAPGTFDDEPAGRDVP